MAGNLNKVMLIGRLGKDPEVRYTKDGTAVANLTLATSEQWKDKSGEKQERTEWHKIVLWGRQAEIAQQYLQKGRMLYVEGRIETRKWQDQNGQDRYTTEIRAMDFQMLDRGEGGSAPPREAGAGGPGAGGGSGPGGGFGAGREDRGDRPSRGPGGSPGPGRPSGPPPDDDMGPLPDEDDIPF